MVTEKPVSMWKGTVNVVHLNFQKVLVGLSKVFKEAKMSCD